tara:strand:- start:15935 stop:16879 length:945 start_codon:yes stop_codon:yes gene_type:complete
LVTGAAGFIGYHLCKSLIQDGHEILGIDNINDYYDQKLKHDRLDILKSYNNFDFDKIDIVDRDLINKAFKNFEPQLVINLAAQPGVRYSINNPHVYMQSNLVGFLNIIELCRHQKIDGLIYASSSSVYGSNKDVPYSINDRVDDPISLYGATKRSNELIARSYSHLYGLNTTGLRYFTVYGSWYRPDMAMYIFIKNIINGDSIAIYNKGKMKRDFTFIDDIIAGTRAAINKNYNCEIFNLGNNKSENLLDMLNIIEDQIGKKANISYEPLQPGDALNTFADIDHSKLKLGYDPQINISEGIPILVKWYRDYYNV